MNRRNFLKGGAAAAAVWGMLPPAMLLTVKPVMAAAAAPKAPMKLADILSMTPADAAVHSAVVAKCRDLLTASAKRLTDAKLSKLILDYFDKPNPSIAVGADDAALTKSLHAAGLLDPSRQTVLPPLSDPEAAPQSFWSAPGSGWGSHHAYPGGLATHMAMNVSMAENFVETYGSVFGFEMDPNAAIGGELLHDIHKPWVMAWTADNSIRKEETLAQTGEHHVLSIAESMKRGVPAAVIVAQACAHDHPGAAAGEALVVGWIKAAAIIAGVDPVKNGYLAADGRTLPLPRRMEGFVVHLADHDFVLAGPACQWTAAALADLAREQYGVSAQKDLNAFRNYALSNLTAIRLYGILSSRGKAAFAEEVKRLVS